MIEPLEQLQQLLDKCFAYKIMIKNREIKQLYLDHLNQESKE